MPEPTAETVSVVAATRDSNRRIEALLEALARQTVGAGGFEVVVVGDVPAEAVASGLQVRVVDADPSSDPAADRNLGWRAARGSAIAFIDDDCEPAPDWIERLHEAAAGRDGVIVQGRTLANPRDADRGGPFAAAREITRDSPHYPASNILYPRALLERLDGFDEHYGPDGADTDLAWRARQAGASVEYAPDALVHHAVHARGAADSIKDALGAAGRVKVYSDHPQLRSELDKGLFLTPTHFLVAQAALGAVLATRKPAALLFTVPYVTHVFRRAQAAGAPAATPLLVVRDAVEFAATIAGAIRHRTPVL